MEKIIVDILLGAIILTAILFKYYTERNDKNSLTKKQKNVLKRIGISAAIVLILQFVSEKTFYMADTYTFYGLGKLLRFFAYIIPYYIVGNDILKKALNGIKNKRIFDENFLMCIATVGAFVLAITGNGDYIEAVAVMMFYQLGELFQSYAVGKSRRSISAIMDIRPDYANIETDGTLKKVDPYTVSIGTVITVLPGEKVPLDGIVDDGISTVNTSALTGESIPRDVNPGDEIISGFINLTGVLKIRTTKGFDDSTVCKILELVQDASSRKSKSENFISKFSKIYTPAVCLGALMVAVFPPFIRAIILGLNPDFITWLYRALTFLVISCPCALVISIPLTFFAGLGGACSSGVLIKGSNYMETLARIKTVVFDKTGTLTKGIFEIADIYIENGEEATILELVAHAESMSNHPIAKSIQNAYGKPINQNRVHDVKELSGLGITAKVDDISVVAGNSKLMDEMSVNYKACNSIGTAVHIVIDNIYAGYLLICDTVKENSAYAISQLKKKGIKKTVMLTGDKDEIAKKIGNELGIDEIHSELFPSDKVSEVEKLLNPAEKLAFVGDGVNDAPVLSRADVGIAMGAMGSDAAIEAADVVIMDDDPTKIIHAIKIARKCIFIVYQNIIFALAVKLICLILGALGKTDMWIAIFADVGVMVITVINSIRSMYVKKIIR